MKYQEAFSQSLEDPEAFWGNAADQIDWDRKWDCVLNQSNSPFFKWFPGAKLNTCFNAVDRHVLSGRGDQLALIYDSPVTDTIQRFTYAELKDRVCKIAGFLKSLGVAKGDRVLDLHAHDSGSGDGHAGVRTIGSNPFGGVRRLCRKGTRGAHRRCRAKSDSLGFMRH